MFYITTTVKFRAGTQRLYAVGNRDAVVQAARDTFRNHQMAIRKEKDQVIYHFPGGWADRTFTNINRFYFFSGAVPQSDCFSIKYTATNNLLVTTLLVNLYH